MPMTPSNKLVKQLKAQGLTLALAESMTAGLASSKLAVYKGVAEVLTGSIVCYSPEVKHTLLDVSCEVMDKYTCESREVTEELATNLANKIHADIHAAITGLACEGGSETPEKPVGTVFFSVLFNGRLHSERRLFRGTPSEIREKACGFLYDFVLEVIG
jgi:nicotinamide-nucleotide amidase